MIKKRVPCVTLPELGYLHVSSWGDPWWVESRQRNSKVIRWLLGLRDKNISSSEAQLLASIELITFKPLARHCHWAIRFPMTWESNSDSAMSGLTQALQVSSNGGWGTQWSSSMMLSIIVQVMWVTNTHDIVISRLCEMEEKTGNTGIAGQWQEWPRSAVMKLYDAPGYHESSVMTNPLGIPMSLTWAPENEIYECRSCVKDR